MDKYTITHKKRSGEILTVHLDFNPELLGFEYIQCGCREARYHFHPTDPTKLFELQIGVNDGDDWISLLEYQVRQSGKAKGELFGSRQRYRSTRPSTTDQLRNNLIQFIPNLKQ